MDQQNIKFLISLRLTCVTFANKMFIVRNVWLLCCIISLSIHYDINMSKNEYFEGGLTLLATTVFIKTKLYCATALCNRFYPFTLKLELPIVLEQGWASFSHEGPDLEKLLKPRAAR